MDDQRFLIIIFRYLSRNYYSLSGKSFDIFTAKQVYSDIIINDIRTLFGVNHEFAHNMCQLWFEYTGVTERERRIPEIDPITGHINVEYVDLGIRIFGNI